MEKLTGYNYRKIINLVLLLTFLLTLIISTVIKNSQYSLMLWMMMFSSAVESGTKTGAYIFGGLIVVMLIVSLVTIPHVLRSHDNAYFGVQGFMSVALAILLIANKYTKVYTSASLALLIIAFIVNIAATIYNIFIVKYNYDELYGERSEEVAEENK